MRIPLPLALALLASPAPAQFLMNDFDGSQGWEELPIAIDTAAANTWQTGPPQKPIFASSYSPVNALVTDTIAPVPPDNMSRFTILMPTDPWDMWPEFFLNFQQKYDLDAQHAGAFIEVSYDTGATWMNVFDDWVNPPVTQFFDEQWDQVLPDTLSNGEVGFTGLSGSSAVQPRWVWSSFCWVQTGIPLPDTVRLRFTCYTDSAATQREGWMLDDFQYMVGPTHPISDYMKEDLSLRVAPNPMADHLFIAYDTELGDTPVRVDVLDATGRRVRTLVDQRQPAGRHSMILRRDELPGTGGLFFLHAIVDGEHRTARFLVRD